VLDDLAPDPPLHFEVLGLHALVSELVYRPPMGL
jgi:hypothetical protein